MKQPTVRKPVNRGLVVSLVLLGLVAVYVLVTQLTLVPQKKQLKDLTSQIQTIFEEQSALTDLQLEALKSREALADRQKEVEGRLSPLFHPDSGYTASSASLLLSELNSQVQGDLRIRDQQFIRIKNQKFDISEDTAKASMEYEYTVDGGFYSYNQDGLVEVEDGRQTVSLSLTFKRVDGEWKIYRIGGLYRDSYESVQNAQVQIHN